MRSRALTVACVLVGGLALGEARVGQQPLEASLRPIWTETKWPFLYDAWGAGKAFHCTASACGGLISIYIRPKIGFCNCYTGVADDDEIDRVGDVSVIGEAYRPLEPGKPVTIGEMAGRSRSFVIEVAQNAPQYAIGIAVSKKCDAMVATIVSGRPISPRLEQAALTQLNTEPVTRWASASVGLQ
jgi:hypothetical protein